MTSTNSSAILVSAAWDLLRPLQLPNYPDSPSSFLTKISAPLADSMPAEAQPIPDLINAHEFSRRTGICLKSARALARNGKVPSIRIGRRILFPVSVLMMKPTAQHREQKR